MTPGMTNTSETRLREIVAEIDGILKDLPQPDGPGAVSSFYTSLSLGEVRALAADTIDRLTSTGEAVAFEGVAKRKLDDLLARGWTINGYAISKDGEQGLVTTGSLVGWWSVAVENARKAELALEEARAASPREGHVEVPVEPVEPGVREAFTALDLADSLIERAYGLDVPREWNMAYRKVAKARAALPHNQGETKPEAWDLAARAENGETNL